MKSQLANINKSYIIAGGILVLVVIVVGIIVFRSPGEEASAQEEITKKPEKMEVIPTVNSSVKVDLEGIKNNTRVVISIANAPKGTEEVEATITYYREEAGMDEPVRDGGSYMIKIKNGKGEVEALLGTASSGVERHHKLTDGEIHVDMMFMGSYGKQIYQDDFKLKI